MTATRPDEIRIWPAAAPGSEAWAHDEELFTDPNTGMSMIRTVVVPTLTPVLPEAGTGNGTAVVVAPGGAFAVLAWHHEGMQVAEWLAERGVAAFVLKYRLSPPVDHAALIARVGPMPDTSDGPAAMAWLRKAIGDAHERATADGEQSIRMLRSGASQWAIDPSRIGMMGFSAGGTVVTQTAATTDPRARPAFIANIYGAFCDRDVPADAPPMFGVLAADDTLCRHSFFDVTHRWIDAGIPTEVHVYETGGHGFGMTPQGAPVDTWIERLGDWLSARGLLASG